ncbi:hypothetical protein AX16_003102 [Volvariella volvacea WC 439]|nr:hypothetical protein AX16_003102 [Volvariella volvacea WC 439]
MLDMDSLSEHACDMCGMPGDIKCKGCEKAWYCGDECRNAHWDYHFFDCKPLQPKHSGFHLVRAVYEDEIPDDVQTQLDFGFSRCRTDTERSNLLGLYTGVIKIMGIRAKAIYRWKNNGTLAQRIQELYETRKQGERGDYYEWFLRNKWALDDSVPPPERRDAPGPSSRSYYANVEPMIVIPDFGEPVIVPVVMLPPRGPPRVLGRRIPWRR